MKVIFQLPHNISLKAVAAQSETVSSLSKLPLPLTSSLTLPHFSPGADVCWLHTRLLLQSRIVENEATGSGLRIAAPLARILSFTLINTKCRNEDCNKELYFAFDNVKPK